jgi:hypothetical protein
MDHEREWSSTKPWNRCGRRPEGFVSSEAAFTSECQVLLGIRSSTSLLDEIIASNVRPSVAS